MLPREYFVTTGAGESNTSALNAFDNALIAAEISQCNLVPVSSIIPVDAVEVERKVVEAGSITFVVMARFEGKRGQKISAGIGYLRPRNEKYGTVVEATGRMSRITLERRISKTLDEVIGVRGLEGSGSKIVTKDFEIKMKYGSVISALVFVP